MAFWSSTRFLLTSFFCSPNAVSNAHLPQQYVKTPWFKGSSRGGKTYRGLLALLEEGLLAGLLLLLLANEVLGLGDLLNLLGVEARDVDAVRRRDDVASVDPADGHAVDLEGPRDEEDALVEGLEEDDALAAEAAGEEDQDRAGLERRSGGPGAEGLAGLCLAGRVSVFVQTAALTMPIVLVFWGP